MDTTDFHAQADALLEALESALEARPELEAELHNGILTIEADVGNFVLNKHEPTLQVWLSSPVSGAARFVPEGGQWRHAATRETLQAQLARELGLEGFSL